MNDRISVIIPTYNASKYVTKAIDSVLVQDYINLEIIIIDDGSTDNTQKVLDNYKDKIRYVYQDNGGAAKARNTGIKLANGDYIAFLDADDLWLPDKLGKQMNFFNHYPQYSMVFTDMSHSVDDEIVYKSYLKERRYKYVSNGSIYENLLRECFIFTPTVMIKRKCFEKVGIFKEYLKISEDLDLWLRIADKYLIGFLDEPLVIRRKHETNLTGNRLLYISSNIQMMEEIYIKNKGHKIREKILKKELGYRYFQLGYYFFELSQQKQARNSFFKSLKCLYDIKSLIYILTSLLPKSLINNIRMIKRRTQKTLLSID
jgi:glycosyltransferase involved in cell wall biosynthesis